MSIRLKHIADIEGRDPVHCPAVSPAEGRFKAAAVERASEGKRSGISSYFRCEEMERAHQTRDFVAIAIVFLVTPSLLLS